MFHVSAVLALSAEELYVCPLQLIVSSQNSFIYVVWCCKKAGENTDIPFNFMLSRLRPHLLK